MAKTFIRPRHDNIPNVGDIIRLKGSRNLLVVVDNETLESVSHNGSYWFHGITCINVNAIGKENPSIEIYHFPNSSWGLGTAMKDFELMGRIVSGIKEVVTTKYIIVGET